MPAIFNVDRLQRLSAVAQQEIDQQLIAGCAVGVGNEDGLQLESYHGLANCEDSVDVSAETLFRIASMTKPITSVAIMMLYERGKFLLDDALERYLPEFSNMQVLSGQRDNEGQALTRPAKSSITVRQLLSHSSGIGYSFTHPKLSSYYKAANIRDWGYTDSTTIEDVVARIAEQPLAFDPGTRWLYGLNTDVLGRLVEVLSGMSFADFLQAEIFEPMGMNKTTFYPNAEQAAKLARVYTPDVPAERYDEISFWAAKQEFHIPADAGLRRLSQTELECLVNVDFGVVHAPEVGAQSYYSGGAGLHSTLQDYSQFCQMMVSNGKYQGQTILSETSIELMRSNNIGELNITLGGSPQDKFGLGFGIICDLGAQPFLSATGNYYWGGAYNTRFFLDPVHRLYAISLTQLYPNFHCDINNRLMGLTYQALESSPT
ncbi:MAG: serine hydrolase domain-containing protein [Planctomycetota bacterium]|nr:serine hydrolase domain-containing protein [Planctomycetota bacterium]